MNGAADLVRVLLAAGASPDTESGIGSEGTPLCGAACWGHTEAGRALLEHGADPNLREGPRHGLGTARLGLEGAVSGDGGPARRGGGTPALVTTAGRAAPAARSGTEKGLHGFSPVKALHTVGTTGLNLRPLDPQSSALPSCATSRSAHTRRTARSRGQNFTSHPGPRLSGHGRDNRSHGQPCRQPHGQHSLEPAGGRAGPRRGGAGRATPGPGTASAAPCRTARTASPASRKASYEPPRRRSPRRSGCWTRGGRSTRTRCSRTPGSRAPRRSGSCGGGWPSWPWDSRTRPAATSPAGARLLRRGAGAVTAWAAAAPGRGRPCRMDLDRAAGWARELAEDVEGGATVDAEARAPRLRAESSPAGALSVAYGRLVACGRFM